MNTHLDLIQLGILVVTSAAAVIAATATGVNLLLYRSQTDPEVIVFPTGDESSGQVIWLVVQNVGRGLATNIRFRWPTPPFQAYGLATGQPPAPHPITESVLIDGMTSLGPGSRRLIRWGQYAGLRTALEAHGGSITVSVEYQGGHRLLLGAHRRHRGEFILDVSSFLGTPARQSDSYQIAKHLQSIEKTLKEGIRVKT